MRTLTLAALLLANVAVHAAEHPWRVSVLATDISNQRIHPWDDGFNAGIGVAVSYAPTEAWDAELSVASQEHRALYTRYFTSYDFPGIPEGEFFPGSEFRNFTVHPITLGVTRRFMAAQRVSPYVRAGVRYIDAPSDPESPFVVLPPYFPFEPVQPGFNLSDRASVEAGVGVRVRLTDRTFLRADVMRLLRSDGSPIDPLTRGSAGVTWKF
ncbi:MAG TPA: outer membrane beta-barrel protein [Thermoanaerobaculia bacterium]|nr:outer membrane beta-barrel protein [Thermoanaerobaculia bacterium]